MRAPRLLLRRHGDGIGDWLMMLQAMKHVNRAVPELAVDVDFKLAPRGSQQRELSRLVPEAFEASDVRWQRMAPSGQIDFEISHVIYSRFDGEPFVEGMLRQIGKAIGRDLEFDPTCVPFYLFRGGTVGRRPMIGLVSQSKAETRFKNWGIANFEALGQWLSRTLDVDVVQIGGGTDYMLQGAPYYRVMGSTFAHVAAVIASCDVVVALENFISVLAGHLSVTHACIRAVPGKRRLVSASGTDFSKPSVEEIYNFVKETIGERYGRTRTG